MTWWASLAGLLAALAVDALIGDPRWLWGRVPHPVAIAGRLIEGLDTAFNRESEPAGRRRATGVLVLALLLALAAGIGLAIHAAAASVPFGAVLEIAVVAVMLAQKDLAAHVGSVGDALAEEGLAAARRAVSRIVGRDPESLDEAGIGRAAIESLAENFSDGVVAPAFWYAVLGLPGLLAYKTLNTADSMIGHKTARHLHFGWAAARLDDMANLPASRLSALLIAAAAVPVGGWASFRSSVASVRASARNHRSPNAGWPEAAMAGGLGVALAGPRRYGGTLVEDHWMNPVGRRVVEPADVRRSLAVFWTACLALATLVAGLALVAFSAGV